MIRDLAEQICPVKRSRRKQERPGELLHAALALFMEKGFAATRVEDIAKRAGVSKGTLFLYYSSKEDLFKAVVRDNMLGRFSEWSTLIDDFAGSTADLLHTCAQQWWQYIGSTNASGIDLVLMNEGDNFPDLVKFYQNEVMEPGCALVHKIILRGQARGEFRAVNPDYAVYAIVAMMQFMSMVRNKPDFVLPRTQQFDMAQYLEAQIDFILNGFNAPQAS